MLAAVPALAHAGTYRVYSSYLWHLQQPIYWPEKAAGLNRYQFAYESLGGSAAYPGHPQNNLADIFGLDDRKAAYQFRTRDAVAAMTGPDSGAQLSYAASLIENVWSLGDNQSLGYGPTWYGWIREARGWKTTRNESRLEPVGFAYHHALMPLVDAEARRREIAINREIWWKAWGGNPDKSDHPKGFRCSEEAFSTRIIKELVEAGYEWVIVPNHHLSRTHPNYVRQHGKGVYDPPNRADQINAPNGGTWYAGEIDGRGSTESVPFSFQAHRAQYVDPASGQVYTIIVVPMTDLGSYRDGYSAQGMDLLNLLNGYASTGQPCLALFSHDGDNAWGGGFSYYQEAVPNFTAQATGAGYRPTTIQTFLDENPPPANDVVHVEDGAWMNAENDWGHPMFINWLWPPQRNRNSPAYNVNDPSTYADIAAGWAEDFRNWAVIMAAQNYVSTAEQIHKLAGGAVADWKIQEPVQRNGTDNGANPAELAWHYFLAALDSGYMYYGAAIDMEVKPTLACNQAMAYASQIMGAHPEGDDRTGPSVFIPQRYPWNPGSTNYSALTGYRTWVAPSDFHVWTLAYDIAGITSMVLRVRADADGVNPLSGTDNETYAGGAAVGPWQNVPMLKRPGSSFVSNIYSNAEINFFIMPTAVADEYWTPVTGYFNQLLDYYIEAYDAHGNVRRTDIQHVYVGGQGGGTPVTFSPQFPRDCDPVVTTYDATGRSLAGMASVRMATSTDGWATTNTVDMAALSPDHWVATNTLPIGTTLLRVQFLHASGSTIDNNGGGGWALPITACVTSLPPTVAFEPATPNGCDPVTVRYQPGNGPLQGESQVFIHIGRNAWQDALTPDPTMDFHAANPPDAAHWTYTYVPPPGTLQINCVFNNGQGVWDNNSARDWQVTVQNCSGGGGAGVALVPGSPAIAADPVNDADQNNAGIDRFSLDQAGGDAVTVNQGGFGSFGHVYLNYDATNLYIGAIGADVVDGANAMILFLDVNTLEHNAATLWTLSGAPNGLDHLHNVAFDPPMDLAIVLGDEHGDGEYPDFILEGGYNFGQGVYFLATNTGTFTPVAGARLAQFDGTSTNAVQSADDDGNRLTDRWQCALPWSSLNATGVTSLTSCTLAGLMASSGTNGPDRYLSSNYLGSSATNSGPRDLNNFGFTFVTLGGLPIALPNPDRDGDGLPDDWEWRFFGGPTNAVGSADDDGDGHVNADEYLVGTDPRSSLSTLRITGQGVTNGASMVTWQTIGGKRYTVARATNLATGAVGFLPMTNVMESDVPVGIGDTQTFTADGIGNLPVFYQIQWQP
ncbi:MAG: hypothetical protein K8T26_15345 [Lentisphaerae bacterium]|nr:hypothetical protein [Lentisphaerota bacterium]